MPDELNWESVREKWTVVSAIVFLAIIFSIILVATITKQPITSTLSENFNPILMAVLGYLFAYVPTKSSENDAKKGIDSKDDTIAEMSKEIRIIKSENEQNKSIIRNYELVVGALKR